MWHTTRDKFLVSSSTYLANKDDSDQILIKVDGARRINVWYWQFELPIATQSTIILRKDLHVCESVRVFVCLNACALCNKAPRIRMDSVICFAVQALLLAAHDYYHCCRVSLNELFKWQFDSAKLIYFGSSRWHSSLHRARVLVLNEKEYEAKLFL